MGLIIFISFIALFMIGAIYNTIRSMSYTYEKEIAAELKKNNPGWELVSVRHPTDVEYDESPYNSFFRLRISGVRSVVLVATIESSEQTVELWVQVHTFCFWVASIGYERKRKTFHRNDLTQEQLERML
jgi:hypothetical protein